MMESHLRVSETVKITRKPDLLVEDLDMDTGRWTGLLVTWKMMNIFTK